MQQGIHLSQCLVEPRFPFRVRDLSSGKAEGEPSRTSIQSSPGTKHRRRVPHRVHVPRKIQNSTAQNELGADIVVLSGSGVRMKPMTDGPAGFSSKMGHELVQQGNIGDA